MPSGGLHGLYGLRDHLDATQRSQLVGAFGNYQLRHILRAS